MTGAKFENQAHLQPLPLGGHAAEQISTNKDVINRVFSCVQMLSDQAGISRCSKGACRIVFSLYAQFRRDLDGWATAKGHPLD